jgi:hypothetical protein
MTLKSGWLRNVSSRLSEVASPGRYWGARVQNLYIWTSKSGMVFVRFCCDRIVFRNVGLSHCSSQRHIPGQVMIFIILEATPERVEHIISIFDASWVSSKKLEWYCRLISSLYPRPTWCSVLSSAIRPHIFAFRSYQPENAPTSLFVPPRESALNRCNIPFSMSLLKRNILPYTQPCFWVHLLWFYCISHLENLWDWRHQISDLVPHGWSMTRTDLQSAAIDLKGVGLAQDLDNWRNRNCTASCINKIDSRRFNSFDYIEIESTWPRGPWRRGRFVISLRPYYGKASCGKDWHIERWKGGGQGGK